MIFLIKNISKKFLSNPIPLLWLVLLHSLTTSITLAQQNLTLEDAWKIALQNNYTLQQQEKLVKQAQQEIDIQRSSFFPSISTTASYRYQSELAQIEIPPIIPGMQLPNIEAGVKDQYDLALTINQPIFTGFRITNLYKSAKTQFESQQIQRQIVQNQLLFQIGLVYYNIQSNLLQQDVLHESIQRAENQLQRVRNLLFAQQATSFDTLEVANRKLLLNKQLTKLTELNKILVSKLNYFVNRENQTGINKLNLKNNSTTLEQLDYYQKLGLANRAELSNNLSMLSLQNLRIEISKSSFYPQVFASASLHYARPGVNMFKDEWMDYYTIMLNFQWDIWNWNRDSQKVQVAKLSLDNLYIKQNQLISEIKQQIEEAYQNLLILKDQINLQKTIVNQEMERFRITNERYHQGLVSYLDLSSAEHQLTEAQLDLNAEYISWYQYKLQLDYATGIIGSNLQEVKND